MVTKRTGSKALLALTAASMGLPAIAPKSARAQTPPEGFSASYRHSQYSEGEQPASQSATGAVERFDITVQQLHLQTPTFGNASVSIDLVSETLSGASPWFITPGAEGEPIQTLSGATIDEQRDEINVAANIYGEHARTGMGFSYSTENDYESFGVRFSHSSYSDDKNSTVDFAIGGSVDSITPTQAEGIVRVLDEGKTNFYGSVGFSHVFNKTLLIGVSGSYSVFEGYLSDPYKLVYVAGDLLPDARPEDRQQAAFDVRVRKYLPSYDVALHTDYRYYTDSFGVVSNTLKLGAFKNIGSWQLSAGARVYLQDSANFHANFFEIERQDGYYSSDYRLSDFQSLSFSAGIKKDFGFGAIRLNYENYESTGNGDSPSPGLVDFAVVSIGIDFSIK
ncbi:MAG: DUF3570 domain-containing protein [Pseudomonadota bacterium]